MYVSGDIGNGLMRQLLCACIHNSQLYPFLVILQTFELRSFQQQLAIAAIDFSVANYYLQQKTFIKLKFSSDAILDENILSMKFLRLTVYVCVVCLPCVYPTTKYKLYCQEPSTRVFVDLETKVKLRFPNHKDLRVWFLIDLEKGVPPKP